MDYLDLMRSLHLRNDSKIVLLVMDGLGGLPLEPGGKTELETASTPNLDALARLGTCGLSQPIAPGITPGSGPAHLALFGYDPIKYEIGRGILEVLGIGFQVRPDDLSVRGNFCTVDAQGNVTDRRAGRVATEVSTELCRLLQQIKLPGVEVFVLPVREHRFAIVFRGQGLDARLSETDPQITGKPPLPLEALAPEAKPTADLVNRWIDEARKVLAGHEPANGFLLRGWSTDPALPKYADVYGLRAAAIAVYPMYRGVSMLVGMDILDPGSTVDDEVATLEKRWADYDFFFMHVKYTDSRGEDGAFEAKVKVIEQVDALIPRITALKPDVLVVTGDHSTPALMKGHSWHPVPTLLYSTRARTDAAQSFSELECARGALGTFPAVNIMPLAMANALKLEKFGA